ncbi:MAG: hypothetical protein EG825_16005, partial [Rhodocyclaceae bacterium]|nr:hypothetical protein [Rhodocyclaceae bacterium]
MSLVSTMCPSLRIRPRPVILLAGIVAGFTLSPAWAAGLPEPALRLSTTLSTPRPVSSLERSLLRVEWQSARSSADEA